MRKFRGSRTASTNLMQNDSSADFPCATVASAMGLVRHALPCTAHDPSHHRTPVNSSASVRLLVGGACFFVEADGLLPDVPLFGLPRSCSQVSQPQLEGEFSPTGGCFMGTAASRRVQQIAQVAGDLSQPLRLLPDSRDVWSAGGHPVCFTAHCHQCQPADPVVVRFAPFVCVFSPHA